MANLKSNGAEVARYVRRREPYPVLRDVTLVSVRSNGWVLRKHIVVIRDMFHPKGYRSVTAGWKRWYKASDEPEREAALAAAGFEKV